jgi:exonuclease SbcC
VAQYGDARSLDGELAVLKRADEAASDLEERTRRLHELQSEFPRLSDAEIDARRLLGEAEAAEQEATRTYQAATMTRGLSVGDPCPICGAALEQLPKAHGRAEVDKAKSVVTRRKQDVETAVGAALECKTAIGVAEKEMEKARTHRESLVSGVNERYPGLKQDDIMALVNERLEQIAILEIALKRASSENEEALATARQAEAMYRGAEQQLAQLREGLASSVGLATDLVDTSDHPPSVLPDNSAVVAWAAFWSECLGSEEVRLRKLAEGREARAADLAEQALGKLDGWVDGPVAMERIEVQLSQRIAELKAKGAACRTEAARLRDEIARRDKLVAGTGPERERGQTYESLRKELLPANFPKFVVAQALDLLCEHASERLWTMTERYRLVSRGAEFFVVDTWAADEERSVKTLSGGETFLASLSLALALSEHVLTLAADQRVRLECLFIDEGFGSLDRESLDAAINALEILQSQSDRMVALVTHVTELADRLPHIEVVKYQDGSQIEVQQAIAPLPPPVEKPRPRVPRKKEPAVAQPSLL